MRAIVQTAVIALILAGALFVSSEAQQNLISKTGDGWLIGANSDGAAVILGADGVGYLRVNPGGNISLVNGGAIDVTTASAEVLLLPSDAANIQLGAAFDVVLHREAAGHLFARNSTNAQRFSIANTYASATSYEAYSVDWQTAANVALVGTRTAATGTGRELRLVAQNSSGADTYAAIRINGTSAPFMRYGIYNAAGTAQSFSGTGTITTLAEYTSTATSGSVTSVSITPTYNQTASTATNTDLFINRTETAIGTGNQYFVEFQRSGNLTFAIKSGRTGYGMQIRTRQQTVPTCQTNCGTSPSVTGSDTAMRVTMGATGTPTSGFVVQFNGDWASAPACSVTPGLAGMAVGKLPIVVATTTANLTVTTNGTNPSNGDIYNIICIGVS